MSEQADNMSDKLEGMLRRWGAAEAAKRARPGPMPATDSRVRIRAVAVRYLPAAAGVLLAVGLAAVIYTGFFRPRSAETPLAMVPLENADIQQLQADLEAAQLNVSETKAELIQTRDKAKADLQGQ